MNLHSRYPAERELPPINAASDASRPVAAGFLWVALVVLSACVVAFAFRTRDCFVDDAFIGFQYIHNLLAGQGFVFHPGARRSRA